MRIIKSYNMQGNNFEKLKKSCTDYRYACIKIEGGIGLLNLVAAAFFRSGLPLMTVVGVFLVTESTLTVPDFALFLLVGTRVFDPLSIAIMNYSEITMCGMWGERSCALLNEPEMTGGDAPKGHEIYFDHVSFGYGETEVKNIFMVFQEMYLFQDSVANNIRYGKEGAAQAEIQKAISRLVKGRTVVVIAHRLKTVTGADTILVLEQGKIVEQGIHKQLLTKNGLYAKLWNLQRSAGDWKKVLDI